MALKVGNIRNDLKKVYNVASAVTNPWGAIGSGAFNLGAAGGKAAANTKAGQAVKKAVTNRYGSIDKDTTNYGTAIGPTQDGGFLDSYTNTSGTSSYSGGSGGSGYGASGGSLISPDTLYDAEREAYLAKYNAAVDAAKNANAQDLKALSDYIERFREDTKTKRERLEKSYDTQADTLLKSINRFREENAQNVADQRKAYLANQAALESARSEADRQSRIEAAARGLGGSGLQQLAQLQNLINQSQDISDVANENQSVMDKLRKALAEANTDYQDTSSKLEDSRRSDLSDLDTALARAEQDYTTNVQKANDNLRDLLAQYAAGKADNDVSALANLYSRVGSSSGRGGSGSSGTDLGPTLDFLTQQFQSNLDAIGSMTNKELQNTYGTSNKSAIYNNLLNEARAEAVNSGASTPNYNTLNNNLATLLAARQANDEANNSRKTTLWNRIFG